MNKETRLGRFDKWGYKNSFSKGELARELIYMNRDYDKLEQQNKKQQEIINKVVNHIESCVVSNGRVIDGLRKIEVEDLLDILKGVQNV